MTSKDTSSFVNNMNNNINTYFSDYFTMMIKQLKSFVDSYFKYITVMDRNINIYDALLQKSIKE